MELFIADEGNKIGEEILHRLRCCGEAAEKAEGITRKCVVAVRFVTDEEIRIMNRAYRGIDRATDVLSFPCVDYPEGKTAKDCSGLLAQAYDDSMDGAFLGDIVISTEHAAAQAKEYGHGLLREYAYLLMHGLFHLLGYDHINDNDRKKMREKEEEALTAIGIRREKENG